MNHNPLIALTSNSLALLLSCHVLPYHISISNYQVERQFRLATVQVSGWSAQLRDYDSHNHENRDRFWDEEKPGNALACLFWLWHQHFWGRLVLSPLFILLSLAEHLQAARGLVPLVLVRIPPVVAAEISPSTAEVPSSSVHGTERSRGVH